MMQLEGYKQEQYIKWLQKSNMAYTRMLRKNSTFILIMTILYIIIIALLINNKGIQLLFWILYNILWLFHMILTLKTKNKKIKKPLIFTNRAKRLFITNFMLNLILVVAVFIIYINLYDNDLVYFPIVLFVWTVLYYFQSYSIYISNIIIKPIENSINSYFFEKAQEKINSLEDLQVIGITGSLGKTSTKFITATILKQKYKVLNTPESYNTPMGLSKIMNEQLNDKYQVFIAEMGARNIGDIKKLAELTRPDIGVITSIGPTHLDTFKNIDNIAKTKYELIAELSADGVAIFNYDNECLRKLADKTFKRKILYGMNDFDKLDIYAEDIEVTKDGSTFTIKDKYGRSIQCTTKLLGKHNIYNILAAVSISIALGLDLEEIKRGIKKVKPIPHRLNIIDPGTGIIIIDDAFNSNPIGAKAALEVLDQFKEGRKIIVTPGMVELGKTEKEANKEFGMNIAKICDYVILVGKDITIPIYEGLLKEGYNEKNIFIVNDLDEAKLEIEKIARPKDVILFENDLPDNYYE